MLFSPLSMLATGTRTVRGLEAISLAVPPTPGQSILRRPDFDNLATFGGVLDQNGYKSDFVYGGYGYFDNMNDFFSSNGYTIKDRVSIPKEEIFNDTIWGVADEILFTQVLKSMDEHYTNTEPAFEMVMTFSAGWSTVISLGGKYTGSVSGWMNFWGNIGGVLAPIVTAFLVTNYGWNEAFIATSLFGILAVIAWVFVNPGKPLVQEPVAAVGTDK